MPKRKRKIKRLKGIRDFDFSPPDIEISKETRRIIFIILLLTLGAVTLLSLFDAAGTLGVYINNFLKIVLGINRWYLPFLLLMIGYFLLRPVKYGFSGVNFLGLVVFICGFNGLVHLIFHQENLMEAAKIGLGGGYTGLILAWPFLKFMGFWASIVVLLALTIIGLILLFESVLIKFFNSKDEQDEEESGQEDRKESIISKIRNYFIEKRIKKLKEQREKIEQSEDTTDYDQEPLFSQKEVEVEKHGGKNAVPQNQQAKENNESNPESRDLDLGVGKFKQKKIDIPLDLLDGKTTTPNGGDIKANRMVIQKTLDNFGIRVEMGDAQVGPTVTQYTLKPAEGVKLSRITALADNLALALAAHPIRIEAPIPGKSLVGIEVPNQATAIVPLAGILKSQEFINRKTNLSVALGKDVMGHPWLADLAKMPHLLIAGATNSGKSVCINSVIVTLLFQNGPGDLKFIMVDPKRVELPIYNGIPHLLTPVITDTKRTVNALRWTIKEMEKRFDILSEAHHRNIQSYNAEGGEMPYIVFVIDELADLMASAGVEVEAAIVRLAQMSRAVGIHLVLATQRPSVDVLTGLIKANITSRVAFSVASLVDSRTILDMSGAEKLLGRGDMLYISSDISKPKRLQGAYASDPEIKRVIEYLKNQSEPDYIEEVVEKQQTNFGDFSMPEGSEDGDPLLGEAKDVILRAKKASASLLQRRLRIGYARAARILDLLEGQGIIGPGDGAKPREILMGGTDNDIMEDQEDISEDNLAGESDDEYDDELPENNERKY
jgi:S-DNA-T family DNA segregation ATPase FtsK/SpoIIIE